MTQPHIVLVHGAWHGAWCWSRLQPELTARGLASHTVDLTTQGFDAGCLGDLHSDAEAVRRTVRAVGGPVVLLGHSYGGIVITEAAAGLDDVVQLVYLAAFLPDDGDSVASLTGGGAAPWMVVEDGLLSVPPGQGRPHFYSRCDEATAAEAEDRLRPQTAGSFAQPVASAAWRRIPSVYLVCSDDRSLPPAVQRRWAERVSTSLELPTDHSPFLSAPGLLASTLARVLPSVTGPPAAGPGVTAPRAGSGRHVRRHEQPAG